MRLNVPQRMVVCLGCLALLGMVVYPPWICRFSEGKGTWGRGYGWILDPPDSRSFRLTGHADLSHQYFSLDVDVERLVLQCLAVTVASAFGVIALGARRGKRGPAEVREVGGPVKLEVPGPPEGAEERAHPAEARGAPKVGQGAAGERRAD
jgi:hypothetical protein